MSNPFAGTCADNLWGFAACFNPSGKCTYDMTKGEMSWANGARFTMGGTMGQPGSEMVYWSPDGKKCATAAFTTMSQELTTLVITDLTSNTSFQIEITGEGEQTIVCPDGKRLTVTSAEMEAFQACSGTGQDQQEQCEVVGMPGQCSASSPCPDGGVCCTMSGYSFCMPAGAECPPEQQ
jgi:hypothetical protein